MWQCTKLSLAIIIMSCIGTINYLDQSHVNLAASVSMKYSLTYPSLIAPVPVDGAVHDTVMEFLLSLLL